MVYLERFKGHSALVTGGATGIGRCVSERLLSEGGKVAALGIEPEPLADLEANWGKQSVFARTVDITDHRQVEEFIDSANLALGEIDILINNAGSSGMGAIQEITDEELDQHYAVNVKGPCYLVAALLPKMRKIGRGSIVNVGSILGLAGYPGTTAYASSKAGLIQLTRTWAIELVQYGIRVNAICPGYVETPRIQQNIGEQEHPNRARYQLTQLHPMGRLGQPEEIANAILFLASDEASFITGAILAVDGGYTTW
jgi:NAD(P)-dependent dehydrogenase (short-subunit alcohol dehydrogenase family)